MLNFLGTSCSPVLSSAWCDMAQEAWQRCMDDVGLPAAVAKLLIAKGYVSKASYTKAFRNEEVLEKFIEAVLTRDQPCGVLALGDWEIHPVAGMLRELWEHKDDSTDMQLALPQKLAEGGADSLSAVALLSWPGALGSKLSADEISKLWSKFEKDYPSEVLEVQHRPCKQLIQLVNQQKSQGDLRFVPWKQLLTEAQCDNLKQGVQKKEKSFLS